MPHNPVTPSTTEHDCQAIGSLLSEHAEWIYSLDRGRESGSLRRTECDLHIQHGQLFFSYCGDRGARLWRVTGWQWTGEKLLFEASRRLGAESAQLEMIPRASAAMIAETVSEIRIERCLELARLTLEKVYGAKIEKARLSPGAQPGKPGRYSRIILQTGRERTAVTAIVAENNRQEVDNYLSHALIWFLRMREAVRGPFVRSLWIVVAEESLEQMQRRVALLADDLRASIVLFTIDEGWSALTVAEQRSLESFLTEKQQPLRISSYDKVSESARAIIDLAPESIDRIRGRHGETLRFHGMPFARVRTLMGRERVWFGLDRVRRKSFDEESVREWDALFADLTLNRVASQSDRRHALYRALPEAWLESLLRRDVTKLDPGLIVAPIHAQFRTTTPTRQSSRPIDLLSLRKDGRLAVIELKVTEDIALVLQGAEYWLRVEAHRRHGQIAAARLFGDREIADEPVLVYLVAPTLRFHRAFSTLAKCIRREIQLYRFDINENWRGGVKVMRREPGS